MAIRFDYVARETGNNLVRNPSLTIATILTVTVSLILLGAALVVQRGVSDLDTRFKDDVEFIVWMVTDADQDQVSSVEAALQNSPGVKSHIFVNKSQTYAEFVDFWEETPEVLDSVSPADLPTSFRVVPKIPDLAVVESLGQEFEGLPGVLRVDFAGDVIKQLNTISRAASFSMTFIAMFSGAASLLLMYNTIRTALFARRREIEVMRLVGATNWFIRIPFMLEGLIQGIVGALIATASVWGAARLLGSRIRDSDFKLFESFALSTGQLVPIALILLLSGALIGAFGSGVAVTRYLDA